MSEWKEVVLGDLVTKITKGTTPPKGKGFVDNDGINYIKSDAIEYDGTIDQNKFVLIDEETHKKFKRSQLKEGDILFSMAGNYLGKSGIVTEQMLPANTNQALAIIRLNQKLALPQFIGYCFRQPNMIRYVNSMSAQSAQPNINFQEIASLFINLPEIDEQKQIINVLGNLDQKITLLREQNQTLDELAQTLFKRWFVEFEFPNENGKPYKSSGGKMVESELGEIPEGWRVGEVADFVNHSTKSVSPSKEPNKIFSHYSIPAFDSGRYPTKDTGESILSNKYEVIENSILVSKLNPSTSRIWTVFDPCENGICSTEIQVFVPNTNAYAFSFGLFHYSGIKREMAQRASGTSSSHQRVRPGDILNIEFVVPKEETLKKFEYSVLGSLKKIEENQEEIQSLTQLRDILLPKLMSGELRVKE